MFCVRKCLKRYFSFKIIFMKEKTHINFQIRISLANTILNYTQNFLLQICSSEYLHNILSLKLYLERENHLLMCFYSRSVSNWIILHIVIIPQTCFSKFGTKHVINMFCERKCFYVIFLYFEKLFFLNFIACLCLFSVLLF